MYMFLAGLGLLVVVGLHQLLESRKVITDEQLLQLYFGSRYSTKLNTIQLPVASWLHCGFVHLQVCYTV